MQWLKITLHSHLTCILSPSAVAGTQHAFSDAAVERLAAVAFFCGDDGQRDSAEGGGDLAGVGAGVSPAWHSTHPALRHGGVLPRQQSDGDVAVQVDRGHQLERRRWAEWSVNREEQQQDQQGLQILYLYEHDVIIVGGVVILRVGHQELGEDLLFRALVDGQRVVACHYHHPV